MTINKAFIGELQHEAAATRKILERIPTATFDWKPHEKSMSMNQLATHVADMFGWFSHTLEHDELDFAKGYEQPKVTEARQLVEIMDKNVAAAIEILERTDDATFMKNWTLRNGEEIYMQMSKVAVVRSMVMNHIVHHRGQLSVYLRLNDIPVPGMYGPSADEGM